MKNKIAIAFIRNLFVASLILFTLGCEQEGQEEIKDFCDDQTSNNIIYHDFDNDGDLDISAVALYHIKVFENDGLGNFNGSCVFQVDTSFDTRNTIGSTLMTSTSLDNDAIENDIIGFTDFVYNDATSNNRRSINLITYTNLGTPAASFDMNLLRDVPWPDENFDIFEKPKVADVNNDGFNDLIYNTNENSSTQNIVWHENLRDGTFDLNSNLFPYYEGSHNIISIFFQDLNNDSNNELLLFDNFNKIGKWYDFSGNKELMSQMNLGGRSCRTARFEDMNGDGLKDIIMLMGDYGIHLLYRDPSNVENFLYSENGYMPMSEAIRFYIADVDGDSKNDILINYYLKGTEWKWIKNRFGTPEWEWKENEQVKINILDTDDFSNLRFEDIDFDGDTDFLVLYEEFEICLYTNNGGAFSKTILNL